MLKIMIQYFWIILFSVNTRESQLFSKKIFADN